MAKRKIHFSANLDLGQLLGGLAPQGGGVELTPPEISQVPVGEGPQLTGADVPSWQSSNVAPAAETLKSIISKSPEATVKSPLLNFLSGGKASKIAEEINKEIFLKDYQSKLAELNRDNTLNELALRHFASQGIPPNLVKPEDFVNIKNAFDKHLAAGVEESEASRLSAINKAAQASATAPLAGETARATQASELAGGKAGEAEAINRLASAQTLAPLAAQAAKANQLSKITQDILSKQTGEYSLEDLTRGRPFAREAAFTEARTAPIKAVSALRSAQFAQEQQPQQEILSKMQTAGEIAASPYKYGFYGVPSTAIQTGGPAPGRVLQFRPEAPNPLEAFQNILTQMESKSQAPKIGEATTPPVIAPKIKQKTPLRVLPSGRIQYTDGTIE